MRRRYRRHSLEGNKKTSYSSLIKKLVGLIILVFVLYYAGNLVLSYFGTGNTVRTIGTTLTIEEGGITSVSIEGEELKRGENGQKLYPGDRVTTSGASRATINLFDGSEIIMEEMTDVSIVETYKGELSSHLKIHMQNGSVWIQTPTSETFSGSIARVLSTSSMLLNLPAGTEALIQPRSIIVYESEGIGISLDLKNGSAPVIIGEGQKFTLPPDGTLEKDYYKFRSALNPLAVQIPFVEESRKRILKSNVENTGENEELEVNNLAEENEIILTAPEDGITVDSATVEVEGSVGQGVSRVRINGYNVIIEDGIFSQELALPDEDEIDIVITALSSDGETLAQLHRKVMRNRAKPESPTITYPAANGETFQTNEQRIEITGTAPKGTVGIQVNDYRLQLFEPGDTTWTYLASYKIDNFKPGENIYKITAINKGGYQSEPAILTIILGEGLEGVITEGDEENNDQPLFNNAPLQPGTLAVTLPATGTTYNAKESSFLIEGKTSSQTDSLWINGYRLRLYESGKTTWNYIADVNLNTLKRGTNTYEIVARDEALEVIDRMTYKVEFNPSR